MSSPHRNPLARPGAIGLVAMFMATGVVAAPSTHLDVDGAVTRPTSLDLAGLRALPAVAQTVSFSAAGVTQTHDDTGTRLWSLLNGPASSSAATGTTC